MPIFTGSDGATLYYDDLGIGGRDTSAPPVIVLAGGAAMHPRYLGDLAGLADDQRLIVPHLRGVGNSPLPEETEAASFWRQADDIERLRVHLGLDNVLLLGHSAGTRLAISHAAQHVERVAGMVLVTPPAGYLVDAPSDTQDLIDMRRGDAAFDVAVAAWASGPDTHDDAGFNAWYQRVAPLGYAAWGEREQAHAATAEYS